MKVFTIIIIAVVAAATVAGLWFVGSPKAERERRFDDIRVQHLQTLQAELVNYWQAKGELPGHLTDLNDSLRGWQSPHDPETNELYDYQPKDAAFSLCAVFKQGSDGYGIAPTRLKAAVPSPAGLGGPFTVPEVWDHPAGRFCFDRVIDKDFFKRPKI